MGWLLEVISKRTCPLNEGQISSKCSFMMLDTRKIKMSGSQIHFQMVWLILLIICVDQKHGMIEQTVEIDSSMHILPDVGPSFNQKIMVTMFHHPFGNSLVKKAKMGSQRKYTGKT